MKPKVYLETTIVSYLTARPARDAVITASITQTKAWWDQRRAEFELWVSDIVLRECARGDAGAAKRRLEALELVSVVKGDVAAQELADFFVTSLVMPPNAADDALHIAIAAIHRMDYLLTWNCRHIASAFVRPKLEGLCLARGYRCPVICTPPELMRPPYD